MTTATIKRRDFLRQGSLLTTGLFIMRNAGWANALKPDGYPLHNIPVNKNLNPAWIKDLYKRGKATIYLKSKNELKYIGMPVGGLHAGTVYLGGDGRLWLWQIYNETEESKNEGIDPKTVLWNDGKEVRKIRSRDGSAYIEPAIANNKRVLEQGFAIRIKYQGKTIIKELNEEHWDEISFEATYPIATVKYIDAKLPVEVTLKAYSPFIPLDADNSSLPATIIRISIKNTSREKVDVSLIGWMENGASKLSAKTGDGFKTSSLKKSDKFTGIFSAFNTSKQELTRAVDYGTTSFAIINNQAGVNTSFSPWPVSDGSFDILSDENAEKDATEILTGALVSAKSLAPGMSQNEDFVISWHFNNPNENLKKLVKDAHEGYYYGKRFADAQAVTHYIADHFEKLTSETERWQQTWNDSTLPHWFLERTFVNIGTLSTANTYRFASGRFWAWEGVGACAGTCTHVWQYAQAMGRIFPELERTLRQHVDLGVGFKDSGAIIFRAENENRPAIDGQAGTILRFYREHQMSADSQFLESNWPKIKTAIRFMLAQDKNGDGMTDTPMENTLDAVWEGEIAWIVGLCIAAARAGQAMAEDISDTDFTKICQEYVAKGKQNMEEKLFNGEYFIHRPDAKEGRKSLGSYNTCHIDQVYGQSWAHQVGLPRVLDKDKTISALKALWKYNFTTDVGPYIKSHHGGRPYAVAGEGGMIMNTNPLNEPKPFGENVTWQLGYFHECMTGFEHQVAAHMMAEGMTDEALTLTRFIHDRHHAAKRNPYNEIECSDHYARAMASYGTFISACGFEYHGPKKYMRFVPKISPDNFKAPFTSAKGWGTISQSRLNGKQRNVIKIVYGDLSLKSVGLAPAPGLIPKNALVTLNGKIQKATLHQQENRFLIELESEIHIKTGGLLEINLS
ncbi:GH116 family glycosyl-hydrolase [Dyadobacter diqingensis]|uniref:GH116 family glycosyl-hydrolase n=1 Tax=Dyadobacter diqingensis TaxID=2938121 RepID=UPI0020C369CC|nr:GH116 family glycosyl-hydrolase [Dyadobacter diqingensis]